MKNQQQIERIIYDFERGNKLGEKSTRRLLGVLLTMAQELDDINRERTSGCDILPHCLSK